MPPVFFFFLWRSHSLASRPSKKRRGRHPCPRRDDGRGCPPRFNALPGPPPYAVRATGSRRNFAAGSEGPDFQVIFFKWPRTAQDFTRAKPFKHQKAGGPRDEHEQC